MPYIDQETKQRILDAADIVEVVSDFVKLKRSGANYTGLCPFHNERTPSFSVSKAKQYCKCFSCGKGGSPVGFIMEHENLSYGEALRWLANKYNIEIKERELTDQEKAEASERESMLAVNDFALTFFEHTLHDTEEGQQIGLSYFRERGLTDAAIRKFRLGFSPERRDALVQSAMSKGYKPELLKTVGLANQSDRGSYYDKFRGRVMYPWFSLSGKVVAFGGRTLSTSKEVAKYMNSPESLIYHKSDQIYGLYQARKAIVKEDKAILVEGYMDVISMSQRGVENVVASSGTSLTDGQIALIHRFTQNVTVIYDSDAAGIKASIRGIDMLLAQGMNIKVLLLPDGEDPDSFAKAHSLEEIRQYMTDNEVDFICFKARIMLQGVEHDPVARASVISSMAKSISVIPNPVLRSEYVKECARQLHTTEEIVTNEVAKFRAQTLDKEGEQPVLREEPKSVPDSTIPQKQTAKDRESYMEKSEMQLMRLLVRYGLLPMGSVADENGNTTDFTAIEFAEQELSADDIALSYPSAILLFDAVKATIPLWEAAKHTYEEKARQARTEFMERERQELIRSGLTMLQIQQREQQLQEKADSEYIRLMTDAAECFVARTLGADPDPQIQRLTADLVNDKHSTSRMYANDPTMTAERDRIHELVPKAVCDVKMSVLKWRDRELRQRLSDPALQHQATDLLNELTQVRSLISQIAKILGERVIMPR